MIERLEQRFIQSAERPALNIAGTSLSYRQLHAHSRAIQQRLQPLLDQHQGPLVVGICLPKCSALYAGILAILGSGAVYLPLEPSHPLQRQQYILSNAGAVLLLHDGQHPLADEMPGLDISRIDVDDVDLDQPLMRQRPDLDAPCMALYTSGTTGHPKGVLLSQANLAHFTAWYADYVQLTEQSRVLQFSSLSFDSSLIDIFPTLLQGAELIVPSDDQRRDPLQLVELIRHQQLSHAFLPPALLSILPLDQLQVPGSCDDRRRCLRTLGDRATDPPGQALQPVWPDRSHGADYRATTASRRQQSNPRRADRQQPGADSR